MSVRFPQWGRPCASCGQLVWPPSNIHQKAAIVLNDRIWHGACAPESAIAEFSVPVGCVPSGNSK